jgi:hypothetical protein
METADVGSLGKRKQVRDKGRIKDIGVRERRKEAYLEIESNAGNISKRCCVVMLRHRRKLQKRRTARPQHGVP